MRLQRQHLQVLESVHPDYRVNHDIILNIQLSATIHM